jgi:hypothetical protein
MNPAEGKSQGNTTGKHGLPAQQQVLACLFLTTGAHRSLRQVADE